MEHFRACAPCPLNALPPLAGVTDAQGVQFRGVTFVDYPHTDYLTFCEKEPPVVLAGASFDSTVLVSHRLAEKLATIWPTAKLLRVDDPRAVFIDTLEYLRQNDLLEPSSLLPPTPVVSAGARIDADAVIEVGAQIDAGAHVGSGAVVHAGTWLKRDATIGENCVVGGVGINAYIGRDGRRRSFPHVAGVVIGEGTRVGAGCVIPRGILASTCVGDNCIIGNLCNVGHGTVISDDVWISVGTLIGGHTHIDAGATIAMGCTVRDNIHIGAHANIGMGSVVTKSIRAGSSVFGNPARTFRNLRTGPAR